MYFVHRNHNLTSFVPDMLIYYVPMATARKAKLLQNDRLPHDEGSDLTLGTCEAGTGCK